MAGERNARQERIEELFAAAQHVPAGERDRFLAAACGEDAALRAEVSELLRAGEAFPQFMGDPSIPHGEATLDIVANAAAAADRPRGEGVGSVIGKYKLLEVLGEGGFGTVFMAQRTGDVQQRVAVKLLKAGMDSREVLARFEAERRALEIMEHPNVARLLDAGQTDLGHPYFVMELVRGIAITEYCDQHRLDPRRRLELFRQACLGVQHAHRKGIIHRDLKPSNVLVAEYDGVPVPKVIDFGIAKAIGRPLTEKTLFTGFGAILGTLNYMSPEQAAFNALDVDTRTDVYALGAILYELLTGAPPLKERLSTKAALDKLLQVIRDEEPPRPSTRLTTLSRRRIGADAAALPAIAGSRAADPATLGRLVRGELDIIAMKALAKDRDQRYGSVTELAEDIDAYLHGREVRACPPSLRYRTGKFLRRHRGPVAAAALLLLALLGGIVGTSWGMIRAQKARDAEAQQRTLAEQSRATAEKATAAEQAARIEVSTQRDTAIREQRAAEAAAARARGIAEVLNRALAIGDPFNSSGSPEKVSDLLVTVAAEVDSRPDLSGDVRGPIYSMIARAMINQGDAAGALKYAEKGASLTKELPPDSPERLDGHITLAFAKGMNKDLATATKMLDEVAPQVAKSDDVDLRSSYLFGRFFVGLFNNEREAAQRAARELVELYPVAEGERPSPSRVVAQLCLVLTMANTSAPGNSAELVKLTRENAADAERIFGADHGMALLSRLFHCIALVGVGREGADEAEPQIEKLLPRMESVYGKEHYLVGNAVWVRGAIHLRRNETEKAEPWLKRAREIAQAWAKNPATGRDEMLFYATVTGGGMDQLEEFMKQLDQRNPSTRPATGPAFDSQKTIMAVFQAGPFIRDGKWKQAIEILEPHSGTLPPIKDLTEVQQAAAIMCRMFLWMAYASSDQFERADRESAAWLAEARRDVGVASDAFFGVALARWFTLISSTDRLPEAMELVEELGKQKSTAVGTSNRPMYIWMRGMSLFGVDRLDEAEPCLVEALGNFDRMEISPMFAAYRQPTATVLMGLYHRRGDTAAVDRIAEKYKLDKSILPARPATAPTTTAPSTAAPASAPTSWQDIVDVPATAPAANGDGRAGAPASRPVSVP